MPFMPTLPERMVRAFPVTLRLAQTITNYERTKMNHRWHNPKSRCMESRSDSGINYVGTLTAKRFARERILRIVKNIITIRRIVFLPGGFTPCLLNNNAPELQFANHPLSL